MIFFVVVLAIFSFCCSTGFIHTMKIDFLKSPLERLLLFICFEGFFWLTNGHNKKWLWCFLHSIFMKNVRMFLVCFSLKPCWLSHGYCKNMFSLMQNTMANSLGFQFRVQNKLTYIKYVSKVTFLLIVQVYFMFYVLYRIKKKITNILYFSSTNQDLLCILFYI